MKAPLPEYCGSAARGHGRDAGALICTFENGSRWPLLAGALAMAGIGGTDAEATARSEMLRLPAALRATCWLRVALRRGVLSWRRGTLATATLPAVTVAASSAGLGELAGVWLAGAWLAMVGAA